MFPASFDFYRAHSAEEAVSLLGEHGADSRILAGGQSLIPAMRYRLAQPTVLVDINQMQAANYITEENGELRIGATVRDSDLEFSDLIRTNYQLMSDVSDVVADPIVRFRGTLIGSLCHNDPSGDWPAAMLAARAKMIIQNKDGKRVVNADEFIVDSFTTAVEEGEMAVETIWPTPSKNTGASYQKIERKVGDYATAAAAVQLELNEDGTVKEAGIGITAVSYVALRVAEGEALLRGQKVTRNLIKAVAAEASKMADPIADGRGSAEYKKEVVGVLVAKGIMQSLERLGRKVEA
ncbi:MAG: xanthine dehydrogenase family protein subunit M [Trueperaceae bacterium]|nr:xanthine dehydrogenase family protein subunit M [Trueperaceae bacterium]